MKRRYILSIICLLLFSKSLCNAQTSQDEIQTVKNSQDLFDERGVSKNSSNNGDGVNVSNVNGNLNYNYVISETPVADGKLTLTMNYCNAVSFRSFSYWQHPNSKNSGQYWRSFTVNKPLWILGLNGFAVQTSSHASRFSSYLPNSNVISANGDNLMPGTSSTYLDQKTFGNEISPSCHDTSIYYLYVNNPGGFIWLVDGYDYCNQLEPTKSGPLLNRDQIHILKADGSVLNLTNLYQNTSVGTYIENAANTDAYAIVNYIDTTRSSIWWDYFNSFLSWPKNYEDYDPDAVKNHINPARLLRYYPGDGYEYIFEEYPSPFGFDQFTCFHNNNANDYEGAGYLSYPTIFYLIKIYHNGVPLTHIEYSKHLESIDTYYRENHHTTHVFPGSDEDIILPDYRGGYLNGNGSPNHLLGRANVKGIYEHEINVNMNSIIVKFAPIFDKNIRHVVYTKQFQADEDGAYDLSGTYDYLQGGCSSVTWNTNIQSFGLNNVVTTYLSNGLKDFNNVREFGAYIRYYTKLSLYDSLNGYNSSVVVNTFKYDFNSILYKEFQFPLDGTLNNKESSDNKHLFSFYVYSHRLKEIDLQNKNIKFTYCDLYPIQGGVHVHNDSIAIKTLYPNTLSSDNSRINIAEYVAGESSAGDLSGRYIRNPLTSNVLKSQEIYETNGQLSKKCEYSFSGAGTSVSSTKTTYDNKSNNTLTEGFTFERRLLKYNNSINLDYLDISNNTALADWCGNLDTRLVATSKKIGNITYSDSCIYKEDNINKSNLYQIYHNTRITDIENNTNIFLSSIEQYDNTYEQVRFIDDIGQTGDILGNYWVPYYGHTLKSTRKIIFDQNKQPYSIEETNYINIPRKIAHYADEGHLIVYIPYDNEYFDVISGDIENSNCNCFYPPQFKENSLLDIAHGDTCELRFRHWTTAIYPPVNNLVFSDFKINPKDTNSILTGTLNYYYLFDNDNLLDSAHTDVYESLTTDDLGHSVYSILSFPRSKLKYSAVIPQNTNKLQYLCPTQYTNYEFSAYPRQHYYYYTVNDCYRTILGIRQLPIYWVIHPLLNSKETKTEYQYNNAVDKIFGEWSTYLDYTICNDLVLYDYDNDYKYFHKPQQVSCINKTDQCLSRNDINKFYIMDKLGEYRNYSAYFLNSLNSIFDFSATELSSEGNYVYKYYDNSNYKYRKLFNVTCLDKCHMPMFTFGNNKFATYYNYDQLNRINQINAPGDFTAIGSSDALIYSVYNETNEFTLSNYNTIEKYTQYTTCTMEVDSNDYELKERFRIFYPYVYNNYGKNNYNIYTSTWPVSKSWENILKNNTDTVNTAFFKDSPIPIFYKMDQLYSSGHQAYYYMAQLGALLESAVDDPCYAPTSNNNLQNFKRPVDPNHPIGPTPNFYVTPLSPGIFWMDDKLNLWQQQSLINYAAPYCVAYTTVNIPKLTDLTDKLTSRQIVDVKRIKSAELYIPISRINLPADYKVDCISLIMQLYKYDPDSTIIYNTKFDLRPDNTGGFGYLNGNGIIVSLDKNGNKEMPDYSQIFDGNTGVKLFVETPWSEVEFIHTSTNGSQIINQSNDNFKISITGDFDVILTPVTNDFTYRYTYNNDLDNPYTVQKISKIERRKEAFINWPVDCIGIYDQTALNADWNVASKTRSVKNPAVNTYNFLGQIMTETDPMGVSNIYTYDKEGRVDAINSLHLPETYKLSGAFLENTDTKNTMYKGKYNGEDKLTKFQYREYILPEDLPDSDFVNIKYGNPLFGSTDKYMPDCHGYFSSKETINLNDSIAWPDNRIAYYGTTEYTDAMNRLRVKLEGELAPDSNNRYAMGIYRKATFYEYDDLGRNYLTTVKSLSSPYDRQTLYYRSWYDEFGRTKYVFTSDNGLTSMRYDDAGSLRFLQNAEQASNDKLTFYEYDNLKRLMVVGEAMISDISIPSVELKESDLLSDYPPVSRLTDKLDPNSLHYQNSSMYYVNSTLFSTPVQSNFTIDQFFEMSPVSADSVKDPFFYQLRDSCSVYLGGCYTLDHYMYRTPNYFYDNNQIVSSKSDNFEDFSVNPQNVRIAYYYDELPPKQGNIWGDMPDSTYWNSISPAYNLPDKTSPHCLHNQIGRVSAIAYRDDCADKFNYIVFSYDERGRIEALLKFHSSIGFSANYYTYNSMNSVKTQRFVDGSHMTATYYNYNQEGLVDSVWQRFDNNGLLISNGVHTSGNKLYYQDIPTIPSAPETSYRYNQLDQLSRMSYLNYDLSEKYVMDYHYDSRHFLNTLTATNPPKNRIIYQEVLTPDEYSGLPYASYGKLMHRDFYYSSIGKDTPDCLASCSYNYNRDELFSSNLLHYTQGNFRQPIDSSSKKDMLSDAYGNRGNYQSASVMDPGGTEDAKFYRDHYTYNNTFNKPNTLLNFDRNYTDVQGKAQGYHHIQYNYDMNGNLIFRVDSSASNINSFPVIHYQTMEYNYRGLMSYYSDQMEYPWVTTQYNYRYSPFGEREYRIAQLPILAYTHFTMIPVKCLEYYALDLSNRQHAVYQGAGVNNTGSMTEAQAYMWPTEYNIFDGSAAGISYKAKYKLVANHDFKFEKYYNLYNSQGSLSCVIASDSTGIDHLSNIYYYDSFGEQKEGVSCDMNSRLGYINKEKDYESGLHDHGVRKYDDLSGRFISVDPLWSKYIGWTPYHYCENDPVNKMDPAGLADYIYKSGASVPKKENDWGLFEFMHKDQYFVEYGGKRYKANSKATVTQTNWQNVWVNWGFAQNGLQSRVKAALVNAPKYNDLMADIQYALNNSPEGGLMDQKHNLITTKGDLQSRDAKSASYLYNYNGTLFNWYEAGNVVWGSAMRQLGIPYAFVIGGAEGYSLLKNHSFDQENEIDAFIRGYCGKK